MGPREQWKKQNEPGTALAPQNSRIQGVSDLFDTGIKIGGNRNNNYQQPLNIGLDPETGLLYSYGKSGEKEYWLKKDRTPYSFERDAEGRPNLSGFNLDEYEKVSDKEAKNFASNRKNTVLTDQNASGKPILVPGSSGEDVTKLQKKLKALGYIKKVTGEYDPETVSGVSRLQQKNGMRPTGQVNDAVWKVLGL